MRWAVQDTHSFCPECATPISAAATATGRDRSSEDNGGGGQDENEISRRNLMIYGGAGLGTAALGGGAGFLLLAGGGGSSADPTATAREFFELYDAGDVEGMRSMFHEEVDTGTISEAQVSRLQSTNLTIQSTDVLSENTTHAKVSVVMEVSANGRSATQNNTLLLQTQDGEWRVRGIRFGGA